jgi:hypothetical protein
MTSLFFLCIKATLGPISLNARVELFVIVTFSFLLHCRRYKLPHNRGPWVQAYMFSWILVLNGGYSFMMLLRAHNMCS